MAEDLGSINLRIEPDLSGFRRSLERATDRIELNLDISLDRAQVSRAISAVEKTVDDLDVGLDIDRRKFTRDLAATMRAAERAVGDVDVDVEPAAGARQRLTARLSAMVTTIEASLPEIDIGVGVRQIDAALAGITTQAARAGASLARLSAIGAGVGAGIAVGGVALGVNSLREFDAALTQSLAIVSDVTPEIREQFKETAEAIATETIFSTDEAGEAYFFLASAGLDAQQQIAALPAVARFAQAGMFDLARATDIVTDAQSALGLSVDDSVQHLENLTRVQDVLVQANILANASVEQFGDALTNRAGAAARAVGKDVEETVAVLAAFADQGTKGRRAGEEFARLLGQLSTLADENATQFAEFGIEVFDSQGEIRNIADVVADFEGALGGLSDQQQTAALGQLGFGEELRKSIQLIVGTSGSIREYEAALRDAGGATEEVAQAQLGSLDAQLSLIGSNIDLVLQSLGQPLADRLKVFFEGGGEGFADFFASARVQAEIAGEAIVVQFERILAFVQTPQFAAFLGSLQVAFGNVQEAVRGFGDAFSEAFGSEGESRSFIESLGQAIVGFSGVLQEVLPFLGQIAGHIAGFISENDKAVGTFAKYTIVLGIFSGILRIVQLILVPFKILLPIVQKIMPVLGFIGRLAGSTLVFLGRWVPVLARIGFFLLRFATPLGAVISIVTLIFLKFVDVRDLLSSIGDFIGDVLVGGFNAIKDSGTDILSAFGPVGPMLKGVADAAGFIADGFGLIGDEAEATAARVGFSLDPIRDAATGLLDDMEQTLARAQADANVADAIKANISDAQVEALQRNKKLAEASAADINAAFRRIGAVAVSTGFRLSLQRSMDGLLNQARFLQERININFQRIGQVAVGDSFVSSFQMGVDRVIELTLGFVNIEVEQFRQMFRRIHEDANNGMDHFVGAIRSGLLRARSVSVAAMQSLDRVFDRFVPVFQRAGSGVIAGFLLGMQSQWLVTEGWLAGRADRIRELKGPLPYDRTVLFEAGRAVIGGFQNGLEAAWRPVESWLSTRGGSMKGIVDVNDVLSLSSDILTGDVADPAGALGALEPDVPRFWTSFSDMMHQAREIAGMFNVQITSSFRNIADNLRVGGAQNSLHTKGQAVDFGGPAGNLDALASWAEMFGQFFQEILWRVAGHFDHVHLGWAMANFPRRQIGGGTQPGQTYLVGENGPELWTAPARGMVHNAHETRRIQQAGAGASYNPNIQVHANGLREEAVLALLNQRESKMLERFSL